MMIDEGATSGAVEQPSSAKKGASKWKWNYKKLKISVR